MTQNGETHEAQPPRETYQNQADDDSAHTVHMRYNVGTNQ